MDETPREVDSPTPENRLTPEDLMKMQTLTATMGAFALTAALTSCGTADEDQDPGASAPDTAQSTEEVSDQHNEADVDYISGMVMHHAQAVEMSEILLEKDDIETEVSTLAEDIREAQGPEIEQMESWLESWGEDGEGVDHSDMEGMDGTDDMGDMEGMMSQDELDELEDASGTEASRLFLEQMTAHHEGAVSSAQDHLNNGENPEALELSETIISDQEAEIDQMETMLQDL